MPKAPVERLIREGGAERVADDASAELGKELERIGIELSEAANKFAKHAGRKTVVAEDVKLAIESTKRR